MLGDSLSLVLAAVYLLIKNYRTQRAHLSAKDIDRIFHIMIR